MRTWGECENESVRTECSTECERVCEDLARRECEERVWDELASGHQFNWSETSVSFIRSAHRARQTPHRTHDGDALCKTGRRTGVGICSRRAHWLYLRLTADDPPHPSLV